jgi:uncharacterized cupredoxin-like copper-binding protein
MKFQSKLILVGFLLSLAINVQAAGDLTNQELKVVNVKLGNQSGDHKFYPDIIEFETGRMYALRLENPSPHEYYFSSNGLADSVFTRKVLVFGDDGKVISEVYGPVRRLELKPGAVVEWWFYPLRVGQFDDVVSTKKHTEAGMKAKIIIR